MNNFATPTEGGKWLEQGGKLVRDTGETPAQEQAPEGETAGLETPAPAKPAKLRAKSTPKE